MAHHTVKSSYKNLVDRLNRFPQGAPPSDLLYKILQTLFSEREAGLVALLPIKPFSTEQASQLWKMKPAEAQVILDELADRAILLDLDYRDKSLYVLPPPMAGFFEFSLMRVRDDINQKALSELFHQYMHQEDDFVRALFTEGDTQMGRIFVNEAVLTPDNALYVLDYEKASEVIHTASIRAVGMCYCRHKMQHLNRACDAPMNICMTYNTSAAALTKHDIAREIDLVESMDLLQQACDQGLVQFGENVQKNVNFICNCCGCCCEALNAARKFAFLNPVHTTNFIPQVNEADCNGCGKCVHACPVEAMTLVSANDPQKSKRKLARLDEDRCLGCGVCVPACSHDNIVLIPREKRVLTPVKNVHRIVSMAIERGKLQHLIFDNQAHLSHRAMAAILGVILKLPPVKQALAQKQLKSRYVETLVARNSQGSQSSTRS